jgi:hypothetical protein
MRDAAIASDAPNNSFAHGCAPQLLRQSLSLEDGLEVRNRTVADGYDFLWFHGHYCSLPCTLRFVATCITPRSFSNLRLGRAPHENYPKRGRTLK